MAWHIGLLLIKVHRLWIILRYIHPLGLLLFHQSYQRFEFAAWVFTDFNGHWWDGSLTHWADWISFEHFLEVGVVGTHFTGWTVRPVGEGHVLSGGNTERNVVFAVWTVKL